MFSFSVPSASGTVPPEAPAKWQVKGKTENIQIFFSSLDLCPVSCHSPALWFMFQYKLFTLQLWRQYLRQPSGIRRRTLTGWLSISWFPLDPQPSPSPPSPAGRRKPGKLKHPNFPDDSAPKPPRELKTDLIPAALGSPWLVEAEPGGGCFLWSKAAFQTGP